MKKMMFFVVLFLGMVGNVALAGNDEGIRKSVKMGFEKEFPHAEAVTWTKLKNEDLYQVRFVQNNEGLLAYVDEEGTVVAVARKANEKVLPVLVEKLIAKKYSAAKVISVDELVIGEESSYLFKLATNDILIWLRVYSNGSSHELSHEKIQPVHSCKGD